MLQRSPLEVVECSGSAEAEQKSRTTLPALTACVFVLV